MSRLLILGVTLFFTITSYCQDNDEWLVEMDPVDGTFEAVGPALYDYITLFGGTQCKDEENGQYIFISAENPVSFISVDISNAEIVDETPHPLGFPPSLWGFHCYENCDSLIMLCRDDPMERNYLAFFDRFNGTELMVIGDSIPDDNPELFGISINYTAFDPIQNQLYAFSEYASLLRVFDIPSGELTQAHSIGQNNISFISYDEVNNKLYGLEQLFSSNSLRLYLFDTEISDFEPIGDSFTSIGLGNIFPPTIDGNNQRMFITRHSNSQGSFMASIDLNTGELLSDVQTMPAPGTPGLFGGPNTLNGQYFNSTDQLITLHWGSGSSFITSTNFQLGFESSALVSPNPNHGDFKIDLSGYAEDVFHIKILNLKGQEVYENQNLRKEQSLNVDLVSGYHIAIVLNSDGEILERIPFVVDGQ